MKKFFYLFIPLLILLLCSFAQNKIKTLRGTVKAYGNEPFVYYMFVTDKGEQYYIEHSESVNRETISSLQARHIEVSGVVTKKEYGNSTQRLIQIDEYILID